MEIDMKALRVGPSGFQDIWALRMIACTLRGFWLASVVLSGDVLFQTSRKLSLAVCALHKTITESVPHHISLSDFDPHAFGM